MTNEKDNITRVDFGTEHGARSSPVDGTGGPPEDTDMKERLARVEEAIDGLKRWQIMTVTMFGIMFLALVALMTWRFDAVDRNFDAVDRKIDTLEQKIDAIPGQLTDIANAIATNITAAKQQPPIIIQVPADIKEE